MDTKKYLPTAEMQADFEIYKNLKTQEEREKFQEERRGKIASLTPKEQEEFTKQTMEALKNIEKRASDLLIIEQLNNVPEMISLAYIAKNYFGKTRYWLYQRIKGSTVNGKPAGFTNEEKLKFQNALLDVSNHIRETSLKIA
jgi:hypothetical protein